MSGWQIPCSIVGCFKRKERESKTSHEKKMKEKEKKKSPPEKQTIMPRKGRLPEPTYNRMKFAYRTTLADVDDDYRFAIGIKKPRVRLRGFGKGVFVSFPRLLLVSHTRRRGDDKIKSTIQESQ